MSADFPLEEAPNHTLSPLQARAQYRRVMARHVVQDEEMPPLRVEEHFVPTASGATALRVYFPPATKEETVGVAMFFHGGGFVMGDVDCYDGMCRRLCRQARVAIVAVEYCLAPEHPFPAAPEDCFAATLWVCQHAKKLGVDASRLAVMGDSAGGNLAAAVALMARQDAGAPVRAQVLIYPLTDATRRMASQSTLQGIEVQRDAVWFSNHYLPRTEDRFHPYASPLLAPDLSGLPPALIVTAEFDLLRDEGEAFAERLVQSGVPTLLRRYEGETHGFFPALPGGRAFADVASFLSRALEAGAQL